jgi:hypothetical protein
VQCCEPARAVICTGDREVCVPAGACSNTCLQVQAAHLLIVCSLLLEVVIPHQLAVLNGEVGVCVLQGVICLLQLCLGPLCGDHLVHQLGHLSLVLLCHLDSLRM